MKNLRLAGAVLLTAATVLTGASATASAGPRTVSYHGYQVEVPAGWQLVDLAANPTACVRFDRPAIYLGRPGDRQDCPSGLVGRTAGLVVEPLATAKVGPGVRKAPRGAATPTSYDGLSGDLQVAVEDAGVLVTAAYTPDHEQTVRRLLGGARLTSGGEPATVPAQPLMQPAAVTGVAPGTYLGRGFDACTAPSSGAMDAWLGSPFRAVGIYISGSFRACNQPNLTAAWISHNAANGWHFLPIDVGRQAPCTSYSFRMSSDPATARQQGRDAAVGAAQAAANLGLGAGSAIYSDIEAYTTNTSCRAAVLSYVSGWTQELNARGLLGGVYSSAASGIRDLSSAYNDPAYTRPDHIWFAWWNGRADVDGGQYVPAGQWANHQRVHQYQGDHNETYNGVTINIDSNYLDTADPTPPPPMTDGTYRIRAEVSGPTRALDVTDCQTQDGADVRIWDWIPGSPCQDWVLTKVAEPNVFKIADGNTGKVLDVAGCSTADTAIIHLWPYSGANCQQWQIDPIGGGAYKIIGVGSGKSLDVAGCSPNAGADVIIWPFHGGACQRWYFQPL
jgi:hypothetical protein